MAKGKKKRHINQSVGVIPKSYQGQLPRMGTSSVADRGAPPKVVENEVRSRELRGCRMPSMRPHTLHKLFAIYRVFWCFFSL